MKIVIFGASGGTGRQLVEQAVAAGHEVRAFVRNGAVPEGPRVHVQRGDVVDASAVDRALEGQDAAVSTMGASNPFRPYPAFQQGIQNILAGLARAGVRRLVYMSFVGVPGGARRLRIA